MSLKNILYLILLMIEFWHGSPVRAQQVTHPYKDMETELMQQVNEHRKTIGAGPLKLNIYISNIAERHSRDMAAKKTDYGNDGYKERTDKIFSQLKPVYSFGENIGIIKTSAKEVIEAWLRNPRQKKNLEGDSTTAELVLLKMPTASS